MTEYDSADIGRWQQAGGTRAGAHRPHLAIAVAVLAVAGGVLTGCSGQSRGGTDQPGVQGPSSVAPGPAGAAEQTRISRSSVQDLGAALRANGVEDPDDWANVVIENQPYGAGPVGEERLRQVLARFRADPDTTARITTALAP